MPKYKQSIARILVNQNGLFGQNVAIFEISRQFGLETLKLRRHCFQKGHITILRHLKDKNEMKNGEFFPFCR